MLGIPSELSIPKNEGDFEKMCAEIYGVVFGDPLPNINGRKGQEQRGVDVYVTHKGVGKIGVQCKKYYKTNLKWAHVEEEVRKADDGKQPIARLLIATTTPSDAALQQKVQKLSGERVAKDMFDVSVDFWEDIETRVFSFPILQETYAPNSPGGVFNRTERGHEEIKRGVSDTLRAVLDTKEMLVEGVLPQGRADSLNKMVTDQLDRTSSLIRAGKFRDGLENADAAGKDLSGFDAHQKARWHHQRGVCFWLSRDDAEEAARLFAKAYACCPDDERVAAGRVRGLMLSGDNEGAVMAGNEESERFPLSAQVWIATANARVFLGENVTIEDAPPKIRGEAEILYFAAAASHQAGNQEKALEQAESAAGHKDSGFFARDAFLAFAVEDCAKDPVLALHGLLPAERRRRLARATELFLPHSERLWSVQTDDVSRAAANLGFAFLLLGDARAALDLVGEARAGGVADPQLVRIEIQALDELGRKADALAVAKEHLDDLTIEAVAAACEIAAAGGDAEFVETAHLTAGERFPDRGEILRYIGGLVWAATARRGGKSKVVEMIIRADPIGTGEIDVLCRAAPIMRWAGRPEEAERMETAALSKIGPESPQGELLIVAETLFGASRWLEASKLYERLLAPGAKTASELHARLLTCYVEIEKRGKAKALLASLPEGWADVEDLRRCAMDMGQMAGDWHFLEPLARKQLDKRPGEAASWLFWMSVLDRVAGPSRFQDELLGVPDDLSGSVRNVAALASLEFRYGRTERALRRLYRLVRMNPDNPQALSAYLLSLLTNKIPSLESSPTCISPGCNCVFEEADGRRDSFVIDPMDCDGLPDRTGFYHPASEFAQSFIGRGVGDEVEVSTMFGTSKTVRIAAIGSSYLTLLEMAQERAARLDGLPNVQSLKIGNSGDPVKDLAPLHEMLSRSSAFSQGMLDIYAQGLLTLSKLSELLGRSPVDVCQGWPDGAPPLFVGAGLGAERTAALELVLKHEKPFVADSFALAELARFDSESALSCLGEVVVSHRTKEIIEAFAERSKSPPEAGTAYDAGGRIGFVEYDESYRKRQLDFGERLLNVLREHCRVEPGYGDFGDDEEAAKISEILGDEGREAVLLAKERGGVLLTLDGRLRQLAKHFAGVDGVWPQALVMAASASGILPKRDANAFTAGSFLSKRSFVSLDSGNILWMLSQGDWSLQRGMKQLKDYVSSTETELASIEKVILEFLKTLVRINPQLGAYGEILGHLAEAVFRRADCPPDWMETLGQFVTDSLTESRGGDHAVDFLNAARDEDLKAKYRFLVGRLKAACERAGNPERNDTIRVKVLFCGRGPTFVVDKSSPMTESKMVGVKAEKAEDVNSDGANASP